MNTNKQTQRRTQAYVILHRSVSIMLGVLALVWIGAPSLFAQQTAGPSNCNQPLLEPITEINIQQGSPVGAFASVVSLI